MNEWLLAALIIIALTALMVVILTVIYNAWQRAKRRSRALRWTYSRFD